MPSTELPGANLMLADFPVLLGTTPDIWYPRLLTSSQNKNFLELSVDLVGSKSMQNNRSLGPGVSPGVIVPTCGWVRRGCGVTGGIVIWSSAGCGCACGTTTVLVRQTVLVGHFRFFNSRTSTLIVSTSAAKTSTLAFRMPRPSKV